MNALVLANALGTTSAMWDVNVRYWEPLRLVRSENTARNDVADLGRDLLALLDEQGIERASLCGLSLGGATAMWVGANAPERVERLVLACTSARFGEPEPWHERAALVREQGMDAIIDMLLGRWFTGREPAEILERFRQMLLSTWAEDYATLCEALAAWDFRDRLAEIRAPTLVIAGAEDPSTPPEHARLIADRVPGARLEVLDDARHLANVTWPERFATLVLEHVLEEVRV
jgi:3-oxoadipate enol-lactonase